LQDLGSGQLISMEFSKIEKTARSHLAEKIEKDIRSTEVNTMTSINHGADKIKTFMRRMPDCIPIIFFKYTGRRSAVLYYLVALCPVLQLLFKFLVISDQNTATALEYF
jgi:hypothetical protein